MLIIIGLRGGVGQEAVGGGSTPLPPLRSNEQVPPPGGVP